MQPEVEIRKTVKLLDLRSFSFRHPTVGDSVASLTCYVHLCFPTHCYKNYSQMNNSCLRVKIILIKTLFSAT